MAEVYCVQLGGICPARSVSSTLVPGFATGTQFVREHLALHVDSRPEETASGLMADVALAYTQGFADDDSSYLGVRGHVGAQFAVWRHRSLYIGITAEDLVALGSIPIPFTELSQLGGVDDLRGFATGRFRGQSTMLAQLEWRWPVWMWMDGALFFDYGGAFGPEFHGFSVGDLRPDIGLGLRVHTSGKYLIRVQVAYGFGDNAGFRVVIAGNGNPS
jgi:outer membrane protein assembly factor BamA